MICFFIEGEYGLELKTSAKKIIVFSVKDKIGMEKAISQYKN